MSYLLDTHAPLWWLMADSKLSKKARLAIENSKTSRHLSAVSAYEIANKVRLGKLDEAREVIEDFDTIVADGGFLTLDVTPAHALLAGQMPGAHKDPFDRLLAAQAQIEGLTVISADEAFDMLGIERLW